MPEQLTIRNFGPIQAADIAVHNLTIFVGPQATGKSLAAQALYFLRGIEELLSPVATQQSAPLDDVLKTFKWWLGNDPEIYASTDTSLSWISSGFAEIQRQIYWDDQGVHLNDMLVNRVQQLKETLYGLQEQIYIPAGRILYSLLLPASALRFFSQGQQQWPGYLITFYEAVGRATEVLWRAQSNQNLEYTTLLPGSTESDLLRQSPFLRERIAAITKGAIQYGPSSVSLNIGQKQLSPSAFSAGQMEIWPFWAIVEHGLLTGKLPVSRIYFEEPEAHLHPGAQRSLMEILAFLVRHGVQVVITTHSPYILYAVNNFLMAQQVLNSGHKLPPETPVETALHAEQVTAYRFAPDGNVSPIMDTEVGLIDAHELEQVAEDLGATFTELQERLEGWV